VDEYLVLVRRDSVLLDGVFFVPHHWSFVIDFDDDEEEDNDDEIGKNEDEGEYANASLSCMKQTTIRVINIILLFRYEYRDDCICFELIENGIHVAVCCTLLQAQRNCSFCSSWVLQLLVDTCSLAVWH
jgi:hypothetical protein